MRAVVVRRCARAIERARGQLDRFHRAGANGPPKQCHEARRFAETRLIHLHNDIGVEARRVRDDDRILLRRRQESPGDAVVQIESPELTAKIAPVT
jgi:hypothetical protein